MTATLTAVHEGQLLPVDLAEVTGLDALVYRRTTGEELDVRIGVLLLTIPDDPADWPLADKAIIAWLSTRQTVDGRNVDLAAVAYELKLIPATEPVAGADAPGGT